MRRLLLLPLVFVVIGTTRPASILAQSPASPSEQVSLSPGDSVRITVWRKPEFSGDFIVAPDGSITHPLYQAVRVGGVPFATAEANVRSFLSKFEQDPQFVMEPLVLVAVSGEVGRPQVFAVRPETSIAEAVARSGGPTQDGRRDKVRVLRRAGAQQREIFVNLLDPQGNSSNLRVHSGDQIVVDKKKSFFREVLLPTLGVIGSVASLGLLIDRYSRR
jgi:polysaccharide export outer membrane protein